MPAGRRRARRDGLAAFFPSRYRACRVLHVDLAAHAGNASRFRRAYPPGWSEIVIARAFC